MEEALNGVIETVDQANHFRLQLEESQDSLTQAKSQVIDSAARTKKALPILFEALKKDVVSALDSRLRTLLKEVEEIELAELKPLEQCEEMIQERAQHATGVMEKAKLLLEGNHEENREKMLELKKAADTPGLHSIPEVPDMQDVPLIHFHLDDIWTKKLAEPISTHGKILARPPVKLTELCERPGGILVKWKESAEEDCYDIAEFQLQYCYGYVHDNNKDSKTVWHTAYKGPLTSYLIKHLGCRRKYSFRICGRGEEDEEWSEWSRPVVTETTLQHHEWTPDCKGYSTSNENKTITKEVSSPVPAVYSKFPSYLCGHEITFKVLCSAELSDGDGIALCVLNEQTETLNKGGTLFVSASGDIYIDGRIMKTKLPSLSRGSSLTFITETVESNKIRTTIETSHRTATFDWQVEQPMGSSMLTMMGGASSSDVRQLYFAVNFLHEEWKISVE